MMTKSIAIGSRIPTSLSCRQAKKRIDAISPVGYSLGPKVNSSSAKVAKTYISEVATRLARKRFFICYFGYAIQASLRQEFACVASSSKYAFLGHIVPNKCYGRPTRNRSFPRAIV